MEEENGRRKERGVRNEGLTDEEEDEKTYFTHRLQCFLLHGAFELWWDAEKVDVCCGEGDDEDEEGGEQEGCRGHVCLALRLLEGGDSRIVLISGS